MSEIPSLRFRIYLILSILLPSLIAVIALGASSDIAEVIKAKDEQVDILQWAIVGSCTAMATVIGFLFRELLKAWQLIREEIKAGAELRINLQSTLSKLLDALYHLPDKCPYYDREVLKALPAEDKVPQ